VRSIKHSRRSSPLRSLRSCATARSTCSKTPLRTQFWNQRCTVWYDPYRGGKSFHGAPVRKIQSTPLKTVRRSLHGRPRLSARTRSSGRMDSTAFHCSSVRSIHKYLYIKQICGVVQGGIGDIAWGKPKLDMGLSLGIDVGYLFGSFSYTLASGNWSIL
jgi:hypothetical protein